MDINNFTVISVKTEIDLIIKLYDAVHKGKVRIEYFTDNLINNYIDIHGEDKMLTTYVYGRSGYKYNFQVRKETDKRVRALAAKHKTTMAEIMKAALKIWVLQN